MQTLTAKKDIGRTALLFAVLYCVSYMTRINFGAVISEMEKDTGIARDLLSLSLTCSFFTYGIGQIFSGVLADKFSPKRLITIGLGITTGVNLLLPFIPSPYVMLVLWGINGVAQALMWPPIVRLLIEYLSYDDYKMTVARVAYGSSAGTMLVYLLSPLLILLFSWRAVFWFCAMLGLVMLLVWERIGLDVKEAKPENASVSGHVQAQNESGALTAFLSPMMFGIMAAIALQGMLRDGVTTWMPTFISETYDISNLISILTGFILPIFSILCIRLAATVFKKWLANPMTCAGLFFGVGLVSALGLVLCSGKVAVLSVLFSAILTGAMHGANLMFTSMLSPAFQRYGKVSTVSGVLNACTYIGSAVSTYGIAVLSERSGWTVTLLVWLGIAMLGTALCFLTAASWSRRFMSEDTSAPGPTEAAK